jgi:hypothetical protein
MLGGYLQEAPVGGYRHDRLRDTERHDFCVCDASPGVPRPLRREIVSRHVNGNQQQSRSASIEAPLRSAILQSTADFDHAAQKSSVSTVLAVESTI